MAALRRFFSAPAFAAAFWATAVPPAAAEGLDIATAKVVDLTHALDANTIFWPTEKKTFELIEEHNGLTERGFSMPRTGSARPSTVARTSTRLTTSPPRARRQPPFPSSG
jgi:hypothetical protein